MQNFSISRISLWAFLLFTLFAACSCDKPNEPQPITNIENPIYFYNRSGEQWLFKYLPSTQTMDSTIIQWDPDKITLSADGKLLYLVLQQSIVVINTENYEFVKELPYRTLGAIAVSNDNKLIAIMGDTLRIIRTSDYQVIYSDSTVQTYRGIFSKDNSAFYCGFTDSANLGAVYKLELASSNFIKTTKSFQNSGIRSVKPTHDQTKWILYSTRGFEIYDVSFDSLIFLDILISGWGSTALSPDSKKVYYTNPGRPGDMNYIPPFIKVFNIETNAIETIIDSTLFYSDSTDWVLPNDIAITADNKYLGVLNGRLALYMFHLIDLETLTIIEKIEYGLKGYHFTPMTVQNIQ